MEHILIRNNYYYFNRRVPVEIREYDPRKLIRFSLKTDSYKLAAKQASRYNDELETYWRKLVETGKKHNQENFAQLVDRSRLFGFSYQPVGQLAQGPLEELVKRLLHINQPEMLPKQVEAILGGVEAPPIKLTDILPTFLKLSADVKIDKSELQYRKWLNPRTLAIRNFINCLGDKALKDLNRDDLLKFRDWWIDRFAAENIKQNTANKHLAYLSTMIDRVSEHFKLGLDTTHLFHRISFEDDGETRSPFTTDYIVNVLLDPERLRGMNDQYRAMLETFAETGVLIAEQMAVQPEDIFLDAEIPHFIIKPRKQHKLKTKYRKRVMPLTGYALAAFQRYPNGFAMLKDNPDSITSSIGKFLKENKLLPTDKHSTYSLRHSFQDRLTNADCPDRIQADLMGHKYQRPKYGDGGTLEKKYDWMKKVALIS